MAQKPRPKPTGRKKKKPDEKSQRERFIETARAIGVDETGREFLKDLAKVVPPKRPKAPN